MREAIMARAVERRCQRIGHYQLLFALQYCISCGVDVCLWLLLTDLDESLKALVQRGDDVTPTDVTLTEHRGSALCRLLRKGSTLWYHESTVAAVGSLYLLVSWKQRSSDDMRKRASVLHWTLYSLCFSE